MSEDGYFEWLCGFIDDRFGTKTRSYHSLLWYLFNTNFYWSVSRDANREADGMSLRNAYIETQQRYFYGASPDYPGSIFSDECSVLEMMIALAKRCEVHIMSEPEKGDRTASWFWGMIESMGLSDMTDDNYDEQWVDISVHRMLNREYASDGSGGLFTINDPNVDMRNVEIWIQMNYYLCELLGF